MVAPIELYPLTLKSLRRQASRRVEARIGSEASMVRDARKGALLTMRV